MLRCEWGSLPQLGDRFVNISSSTERNQYESPLLRLPAEIRIQIYKYVLCGRTNRTFQVDRRNLFEDDKPYKPDLTLLHSSRQVYFETSTLPFLGNTYFVVRQPEETMFFTQLSAMQKAAITSLKLEFVLDDLAPDYFSMWRCYGDVWFGFSSVEYDFLDTLTGLRTIHLNLVHVGDNPASLDDSTSTEGSSAEFQRDLSIHVGESVDIQVHYLRVAERDGRFDE